MIGTEQQIIPYYSPISSKGGKRMSKRHKRTNRSRSNKSKSHKSRIRTRRRH
jgi:hypothetical protein